VNDDSAITAGAGAPTARGPYSPWLITAVVALAVFMEVLDITIVGVALPNIAGNLSASIEESTWVLTSYLVANAIMLPLSGWLATALGRKRFYMGCVAAFTVSSLACGMSGTLGVLVGFRVLQGLSGAGMVPMAQAILADSFPPEKRGQAFSVFSLVIVTGPALGPPLGGWLTDILSWHWIFLINIPAGLVALLLTGVLVQDPPWIAEARERWLTGGMHIDIAGIVMTAVGLGSLILFLEEGQRNDWFASAWITAAAVVAAVSLIALVLREWHHHTPMVEVRLFRDRGFAAGNILFFVFGAIAVSSAQIVPQFAQELLGYTATDAGLAMMFGAFINMLLMPVVGQLTGKIQPRYLVAFGLLVEAWAYFTLYGDFNANLSFEGLVLARMGQLAGFPFIIIPTLTAAFVRLPAPKNNQASALLNVSRAVGGSAGVALFQAALHRRSALHQGRLVADLSPYNEVFQQTVHHLQATWAALGAGPELAASRAYGVVYQLARTQARMLGYIDIFTLTAAIALVALPLAFLLHRLPRRDDRS